MVLAVTFCLDRARTINKAWIYTFPIEALLGIFTFIIRLASNCDEKKKKNKLTKKNNL